MAQRRMFSKTITNSGKFLKMPPTSRLLYYDLGMNADDDGYTEWFTIVRMSGSTEQDLQVLQANGFVKVFDENVLVILDWKENNYLRADRYTPSKYLGKYTGLTNLGIPNGNQLDTQVRLGKDSIGKDRESTPSQIAKSFFEGEIQEIYNEMKTKTSLSDDLLKSEFQKFILYWTEPNKSGTKQRWEQQSTFEVKRRLATWLGKMKDFKTNKNTPNYVI